MKGTNFTKCSTPLELFNENRLVKTKIKQVLGRVGYLMLRDGTLIINGDKDKLLQTNEQT